MKGHKVMTFKNFIVMILLIIAISGCGKKNTTPPSKEKITIAQWGQEKYLIYLPVYLAEEKGFFDSVGIEINIKFSGNDDQVFATVLKGEAQFGVGDPVFTAISRERGAKGKVVASIVDGVAIWGVTKRKDIKYIEKPEDLAGLRVGTFPEPSTNYTLMKQTILKGGDKLKNTRIVQAPIGSQIALIEKGLADIAMELEPAASIAESKGYRVVYSSPRFYGPFSFTGLTTTEEYINSKHDVVQRVVRALEMAVRFAHTNQSGTIEIARKIFPSLDSIVIANAVRRMLDDKTIPEHVFISDEAWQKALQVRVDVGDLKKLQPTSEAVDNSFAETAKISGD